MSDNTLKMIKVGDPMIIASRDGISSLTVPDGRQAKFAIEEGDTHFIAIPRADWIIVFGGKEKTL